MYTFNDIEKIYDSVNIKVEHKAEDIPQQIKDAVDQLVKGTDVDRVTILKLIDQYTVQYLYTKKEKYKDILKLLNVIFITRNTHFEYTNDHAKLKDAISLLIPYINHYDHFMNENDFEYIHHIDAIKHFQKMGFKINVKEGEVQCKETTKIISKLIESKIQQLGIGFLVNLIIRINKIDNLFYIFPDSSEKTLLTPFGYLFNLGVKYTSTSKISDHVKSSNIFNEIIDISQNFAALYRLQNYGQKHQFQLQFSTPSKLTELITRQVCRDQTFKIEQYDPKSIFNFIEFINTKYADNTLKIIKSIFEELVDLNNIEYTIVVNDIIIKTKNIFHEADVEAVVETLTNEYPNKNLSTFFDYSNKNYHQKPFFKNEDKAVYLNNNFCCVGFYHATLKRLEEIGVNSINVGRLLEEFVESALQNNNINIITGEKKYNLDLSHRQQLGISSEMLESDGIIYNENEIFFMEIKKRNLNDSSLGWNIYSILEDLSVSLIHSQTQANRHLRFLTKFGKIDFIDGNSIEHKGRQISKISISSLEYGGLHALQYTQQILHAFSNAQIAMIQGQEKSINLINTKLAEFNLEINRSISDGIMQNNIIQEYMNCYFLNIFQLLYLVNLAKQSNSDLIDEIKTLRNIRLDQSDFYYANQRMRRIKNTP